MKKVFIAALAALTLSFAAPIQSVSQTVIERAKCAGMTKANAQCKRPAATGSRFCKQHDPATARCGAPTSSGGQCKMTVKTPGEKCHFHR